MKKIINFLAFPALALVTKGLDEAACKFNELKNDSTNYYVDEPEMNRLGFDLLRAPFPNHQELSLELFTNH